MGPLDFAVTAQWVRFEKAIHAAFTLNAAVFDPAGVRVTDALNWANPLCPAVKSTPKGRARICAAAHRRVSAEAVKTSAPAVSACRAGMLKIVAPIFNGPSLVGVVSGCGRLSEGAEIDCARVSDLTGLPLAEIVHLSARVPVMSMASISAAAVFMMTRAAAMVHGPAA